MQNRFRLEDQAAWSRASGRAGERGGARIEAGLPGYESVQWSGLSAPAGTPREIITRLHMEATTILRMPETRERLRSDGSEVVASSPEEFAAFIQAEIVKWAKVVKAAGIQPE